MRDKPEPISRGARNWHFAVASTLLIVAALSRPAAAVVPAELLTPQLENRSINLSQLSGGQLSYFDDDRRLTVSPAGEFVRLSFSDSTQPAADGFDVSATRVESSAPMTVELVDGQRLAGRWSGAARDGEAIVWTHPTLGRFTLGLDEVRRVVRNDSSQRATDAATADGDTLIMNNGDRLIGFVIAAEEASVTIQPDGADDGVTLPIENVAQLTLANPASSSRVAGDLIALADGSRVRGTGVKILGQTLTFTPTLADAQQPIDRPVGELRSLDFAASGLGLIELNRLPMTYESQPAFGLPVRPTVRDGGLHLRAPMTVRFALPEGVQRFAASVALDLPDGIPAERAGWADVGLSLGWGEAVGQTMPRWVFSRDQPSLPIKLSWPRDASVSTDRDLTLVVDPAANGPVLDRLRITDAVLLVEQPPVQPGTSDPDR